MPTVCPVFVAPKITKDVKGAKSAKSTCLPVSVCGSLTIHSALWVAEPSSELSPKILEKVPSLLPRLTN